jgi:transketolase
MTSKIQVNTQSLEKLSNRIRFHATHMVAIQGFGYLGQAMSAAEIFATIFGNNRFKLGHDRFVLSPGHYVVVFYAVAAELGWIKKEELLNYGADGALLEAISTEKTPLIDLNCGSLGQGLSGGIGLALAARQEKKNRQTYVFLSDGEMEEGQIWEAAMFAAHHQVGNLTVLLDANNSQVDGSVEFVTTIEPLADKWRSFGWQVAEVNGHSVAELSEAMDLTKPDQPLIIIARTKIAGHMRAIPDTVDAHFIKLDPEMVSGILTQLEEEYV